MLIHGTDKITRDDMAALQHLPDSTVGIMYSLFKQVRPRYVCRTANRWLLWV